MLKNPPYYTMKFITGRFTDNELEQLRDDIVLGSIYESDYKNRFNISPKFISDFFEGYDDFLYEIKDNPDMEDSGDDPTNDYDNIHNLSNWY